MIDRKKGNRRARIETGIKKMEIEERKRKGEQGRRLREEKRKREQG